MRMFLGRNDQWSDVGGVSVCRLNVIVRMLCVECGIAMCVLLAEEVHEMRCVYGMLETAIIATRMRGVCSNIVSCRCGL